MYFDKLMEKVRNDIKKIAQSYNIDESRAVYIGNNKYIAVLTDGREIRI